MSEMMTEIELDMILLGFRPQLAAVTGLSDAEFVRGLRQCLEAGALRLTLEESETEERFLLESTPEARMTILAEIALQSKGIEG